MNKQKRYERTKDFLERLNILFYDEHMSNPLDDDDDELIEAQKELDALNLYILIYASRAGLTKTFISVLEAMKEMERLQGGLNNLMYWFLVSEVNK